MQDKEIRMFQFKEVKYKEILDLPDLYINSGITVLLGASGSGKSTILKMLNKMISPTQGIILYQGKNLKDLSSIEHRRNVTMLSQNPTMFEGNIRDNLTIGLEFQGKEIPDELELAEILKQVQLKKELSESVLNLSGGEKQRLALGRLLLLDPQVYLLDEPSSALDDNTEEIIIQMITEHVKKRDKSAIMVTHSKNIAEKYADEILQIGHGRVLNRPAIKSQ